MGEPVAAVCAATRELARDAADLVEVEYEPLPVLVDGEEALKDELVLHDDAGSNVVWSGVFDWGDWEAAKAEADHVVTIERLHFHRFSSTPLECAGALVEYDKGVQQWTLHCNHQMPGHRRDLDGAGAARRDRQAALRHERHRRRLRQQDLPAPAVRRALPAGAQARPAGAVDGVAHRPAHGERARQRAHVPRRRGGGEGGRRDDRLLGQARSTTAARIPRYEPLGCIIWAQVTPGLLPLEEHPRRLHAGRARTRAPCRRTAATRACSTCGSRSGSATSSAPSSASTPSRCARRTTCAPTRCRTRRRTAASTTRATTRAASTWRSSSSTTARSRSGARTRSRAASCSGSASARRSTRARTTSASPSS